jgi:small subunit ribosomal protein S11
VARKTSTRVKRREKKNIESGIAHIKSTFNNTMISITDKKGNAISWASAGIGRNGDPGTVKRI